MLPPNEISSGIASFIRPLPKFHAYTHWSANTITYLTVPPPPRVQLSPIQRRRINYLLATPSNDATPPTPETTTLAQLLVDLMFLVRIVLRYSVLGLHVYLFLFFLWKKPLLMLIVLFLAEIKDGIPRVIEVYQQMLNDAKKSHT